MTFQLFIVVVLAISVIAFALLSRKKKADPNGPISLHPVHGGGTCETPNWLKVRTEFLAALKAEGNDHGAMIYERYAFHDTPDDNTRSHYVRHGDTYPAPISPCG